MARFHDAPQAPVADPSADHLGERRRTLTELACRSMPFDPPLPPAHPLAVFCHRWSRAGGFRHQDRAALVRLVDVAQRWVAELGLEDNLAAVERRRREGRR